MCSYSRMISEKASLEIAVKMIKNLARSQEITINEAVKITIDDNITLIIFYFYVKIFVKGGI